MLDGDLLSCRHEELDGHRARTAASAARARPGGAVSAADYQGFHAAAINAGLRTGADRAAIIRRLPDTDARLGEITTLEVDKVDFDLPSST
jgi:hypothetical protein